MANNKFDIDRIVDNLIKKNDQQFDNIGEIEEMSSKYNKARGKTRKQSKKTGGKKNLEIIENATSEMTDEKSKEYDKILKSYIEIDRSDWDKIPENMYIRYMTPEGILKAGGRIKSREKEPDGSIKFTIFRVHSHKAIKWSINTKKISKIFRYKTEKMPDEIGTTNNTNENNSDNKNSDGKVIDNDLNKLGNQLLLENTDTVVRGKLDALENRVQKIESDIKRILKMLKHIASNKG